MSAGQRMYNDSDLASLRPAMESRLATDREASDEAARTNGERLRDIARTRLTPERLAIAQEALTAGGYAPIEVGDDVTLWIATTRPRAAFVRLTLCGSGRRVPVNPTHVMRVLTEPSHMGGEVTVVTFVDGSTISVRESDEEVARKFDAVAA